MNRNRVNFKQSTLHRINVSPYRLIGLIEGEGSFYVSKKSLSQHFEIGLTSIQKPVLDEVANFLISLIPNNLKNLKGLEKPVIFNDKSLPYKMYLIKVSHMNYINKILIPFLDNLTFFSKKVNSFNDWKSNNKIERKTFNP